MSGEIKIGLDGLQYMVFSNEDECSQNIPEDTGYACFNGYMNAYCIGEKNGDLSCN